MKDFKGYNYWATMVAGVYPEKLSRVAERLAYLHVGAGALSAAVRARGPSAGVAGGFSRLVHLYIKWQL
jgi:hypothetical protein